MTAEIGVWTVVSSPVWVLAAAAALAGLWKAAEAAHHSRSENIDKFNDAAAGFAIYLVLCFSAAWVAAKTMGV